MQAGGHRFDPGHVHQPSCATLVQASGSAQRCTEPDFTAITTYEPFGNTTATGTATTNSTAYTGREIDATGLYFYRARYYNPILQRFISEDPLGFGGGDLNLYAYAGNSPTNATDPSGMKACLLAAACGGVPPKSPKGRKPNPDPGYWPPGWHYCGDWVCDGAGHRRGIGPGTLRDPIFDFAELAAIGGGVLNAAAAGDSIVLGLRNFGLEDTAAQVGGRTLMSDQNWQTTLQTALGNSETNITVSLDGVSGSSTYSQFMSAAQGLAKGAVPDNYFNFEMGQIYQAGQQGTVTFIRGGQVVPNPFH